MNASDRRLADPTSRVKSASTLARASIAAAFWLLAATAAPAWASPRCAEQCEALAAAGDLQEGLTAQVCAERVCQEAATRLYARNEFGEALKALEYIQGSRAGAASYELEMGKVLYALGRYEASLRSFEIVLKEFPDSVRGGAQRAHALARLGRLDEARAQFQALLDEPGADAELNGLITRSYLLSNVGQIKLRQGDLAGGKADVEKALEVDPRNREARTLSRRVVPALESGDLGPAGLELLERAFERMQLRQLVAASADFDQLIHDWPRFAPAYQLLADGYANQDQYQQCQELLERAEKQIPDHLEIRLARIRCTILRYGVASNGAKPAIAELELLSDQHPANATIAKMLSAIE